MDGWAIWITGLPGSGKSTIAASLMRKFKKLGISYQLLSIDMLRRYVTPKPSYSEEERDLVYNSLVYTALILTSNGINVIIDATANRRRYRNRARRLIKRFLEVYIKCPLDICMLRERYRKKRFAAPKNIYKKGLDNLSSTIPGIGAPYEEPFKPDIIIESNKTSPKEASEEIMNLLISKFHTK